MISLRLSTLGHPQRLALFRLLMRRYPDRVPATELAEALGIKRNTLSTYVGALMQAGLVTQERVGTSLRYSIDMDAARQTFDYLWTDCCRGRPELCSPQIASTNQSANADPGKRFHVLFVCTGNSTRSIFAEAILRDAADDRFAAYSAGTAPRSSLNPFALGVLERNGHDTSVLEAKNLSVFQTAQAPHFDFVFTVCNQAANEECPTWPGQPISAHWGMPDPVKVEGSDAEKALAFQRTYDALASRIKAFAALDVASLDRLALQRAVDDIAILKEGILA